MESVLQALGAPRRREILRLVRRSERSAGEIHRALGDVTFGAVSQHLGVLERAGLVSARREGRSRLYRARPEGLAPLRQWLEPMWEDALAALSRLAEAEERLGAAGGEVRRRAQAPCGVSGGGAGSRRAARRGRRRER
jgi:DNA-binding transcriptional ArsR family regulator